MDTRSLPAPWRFRLDRHDDPQPNPMPPAPVPTPPAPAAVPTLPADEPLGPAGVKALDEFKRRAREAEAAKKVAEDKVREYEDRDKTELERAQATAARATAEAEAARVELTRTRIIAETGLSAELAEFLPVGDEDTIRAAAVKLAAATVIPPRPGPRPDPSQGSGRPAPVPADMRSASPEEFAAELRKYGLRPRA